MTTTTTTQGAAAPAPAAKTKSHWTIDATHSTLGFSVRHLMIATVRGEFQKLSGTVDWDPAEPLAARIEVEVDVASINTREAQRDTHLRSADFFDAEKHPKITFSSRGVGKKKDGQLEVVGDLTIHGVTRNVVLDVEGPSPEQADPWGKIRVGASATTSIKRSDFGMTWNTLLEAGGVAVSDEVKIQIDVALVRDP